VTLSFLPYLKSENTKFTRVGVSSTNSEFLSYKSYNHLYSCLFDLSFYYPNFHYWYFVKVRAGLELGSRELLIATRNDTVLGIAIIKNDIFQAEKKICTLKVMPQYLRQGIGSHLFDLSMNILDTDKPLITVPKRKFFEFKNIFNRFGYTLGNTYPSLYSNNKVEYSFNGSLYWST
jgi:ribosomal protein S18 acetylase RimI-like enzyme